MNTIGKSTLIAAGIILAALLWGCGDDDPLQPQLDDGIVGAVTDGSGEPVAGAVIGLVFAPKTPDRFAKPSTGIGFELPAGGPVHVMVLDLRGAPVRVLADDQAEAGEYVVFWDTRDDSGNLVPNGLYRLVLELEQVEISRVSLLLSTQGPATIFERANAVTDQEGYFRIPRDLIPVGEIVPVWMGEEPGEAVDQVVSGEMTLEAARGSGQDMVYTLQSITLGLDQDRLRVDITLP